MTQEFRILWRPLKFPHTGKMASISTCEGQLDPIGTNPQMFRQTTHTTHDVVVCIYANVHARLFWHAVCRLFLVWHLSNAWFPNVPLSEHGVPQNPRGLSSWSDYIWPQIVAIPWSPWYQNHDGCRRTMKTRPEEAAACSGFHVQGDGGMAIAPTRMNWMKISWHILRWGVTSWKILKAYGIFWV